MKDSDRYVKIVEWVEEDQCYVGSAPGLFLSGCHGDDEKLVFAELCGIVEETVEETLEIFRQSHGELPPATAGNDFANRIQILA